MSRADLVVVGGGPRALMALVALDDALVGQQGGPDTHPGVLRRPRVAVVEPGSPGPGAVWETGQPDHRRLNVDAGLLDLRGAAVACSYAEWARREGEQSAGYPPRAVIGRYLAWAWRQLTASPRLQLRHHRARADGIERTGDDWTVTTSAGDLIAPEVLLCTGHAGGIGIDHRAVSTRTAGQVVTVRGAALTAMDVAFDLTAGRGGVWTTTPATRSGLTYHRSGTEPESMVWVSRSGALLAPKPLVRDDAAAAAVRAHTAALGAGSDPDDEWWQVLIDAACAAADLAGRRLDPAAAIAVLDDDGGPADPWQRWADDLARASGQVDDDPAWWLGRAWSYGYADVVASLERAPRHRATWERFRARAARLERWSFGPPAISVRRLLALRDAGMLDLVTDGRPSQVDAVTIGPGILTAARPWDVEAPLPPAHDALWQGLLDRGLVTVRPGERGVFTTPAGLCVGADGVAGEGLAALGRPTEDPVIGHDTLSRTLHRDADRWAARVAATVSSDRSGNGTSDPVLAVTP
ncbi:FAD/NAD(P)-binding protein [Nocardioides sp.]|uniref:FAD/NAD(P)-binding protein n=1 Tax=Nocardioides sp. TaxID=35761 RepID=UPI002625DC63|nr:FAD/NAD(P)-binding protein [Nocardioides sp.]